MIGTPPLPCSGSRLAGHNSIGTPVPVIFPTIRIRQPRPAVWLNADHVLVGAGW
jgi:hypothetical protein